MDSPNPELMHLYGTDAYYLEKTGQLPGLARALAGAAGFGLYASDQKHQEELLQEAEMMNQQLRAVEADKMQGVAAGFSGLKAPVRSQPLPPLAPGGLMKGGSALDPEAEKVAQAFGQDLAQGMYKQAIFGKLLGLGAKALAGGKGLASKAIAGGGKQVASTAGKVVNWGGKAGATGARRGIGNVALKAEGAGLSAAKKFKAPLPAVGRSQQASQVIQKGTPSNYRAGPGRTQATKPQTVGSSTTQAQNVRGSAPKPAPKTPAAPAATAQGGQAAAPAAPPMPGTAEAAAVVKKKPDPWLSWRSKAAIGAVGLGVGAVGYKGLQAARDVMMQPTMSGGAWNRAGGPVQHSTNQYGYVSPY